VVINPFMGVLYARHKDSHRGMDDRKAYTLFWQFNMSQMIAEFLERA